MPKVSSTNPDEVMSILTASVAGLKEESQAQKSTMYRLISMMEQMQGSLQELQSRSLTERQQTFSNPLPAENPMVTNPPPPTQTTQPLTMSHTLEPPNHRYHPEIPQLEYQPHHQQTASNRLPRMDIPYFSGEGVEGWPFQMEHYFQIYKTPPDQKLMIATFYMTGEALGWYLRMNTTKQVESWEKLARNLRLRFGPSTYWNPEVALNKLYQVTSVAAYITEFEALSIRTPGLSTENLLNRFLTGL